MKVIHLKLPQQESRIVRVTAMVALLGLAASTAQGEIIFQADFNGSGTGTGGASDMVTTGGTGALYSYSEASPATPATATVESTTPIGQGSYFQAFAGNPSKTGGDTAGVKFTPTDINSSWAALQDLNADGSGFNDLNGGFDMLFKPIDFGEGGLSAGWMRPLDIYNNPATGGMRLNMLSYGTDLKLEFIAADDGFTGGDADTSNDVFYITASDLTWTEGQTYHIGFTFETDANHNITTKLFLKEGTGTIDTSSTDDLIASETFQIYNNIVSSGLTSGEFSSKIISTGSTNAYDRLAQSDTYRLYDETPTSFSAAIPEPTAGAQLLGLGALGLCFRRKNRR
jgi:hypothetical protein